MFTTLDYGCYESHYLHVTKKLKNGNFTKILDYATKEVEFQMAFFSLNAVLYEYLLGTK